MSLHPRLLLPLLGTLLALSSGCMERIDAEIPVKAGSAVEAGQWELAGIFGGPAELSADSADPWLRRYAPGGFINLAGIDATADELWACDLGVTRLQVFDFDGKVRRVIGDSMPVAGTMLSDAALYGDQQSHSVDRQFWAKREGARWAGAEERLFIAGDIAVDPAGYWLADWTKIAPDGRGDRVPKVLRYSLDGRLQPDFIDQVGWPRSIASVGSIVALSEPHANSVVLVDMSTGGMGKRKAIGGRLNISLMVELFATTRSLQRYPEMYARQSQAGVDAGKFNGVAGVDLGFDKLIACDTGNRRLQVFEARNKDQFYFGRSLKTIVGQSHDGSVRFVEPMDISIAPDGTMFVLDTARFEVAILSPDFTRIGTLKGDFGAPYAVDLSDDGRHCFVSDSSSGRIFHYARTD